MSRLFLKLNAARTHAGRSRTTRSAFHSLHPVTAHSDPAVAIRFAVASTLSEVGYSLAMRKAFLVCLLIGTLVGPTARAFPRPTDGSENIPKLMADSTLVCKGEITEAPELTYSSDPDLPHQTAIAVLHLDRCFKGSPPANETILVLFDAVLPETGGAYVAFRKGDYRLFFLKPVADKYAVVDVWFGSLPISRLVADSSAQDTSPMAALEVDLKAGLQDRDRDRVLDSIRMLGNMYHLQSKEELKSLLDSPDPLIQTYVYEALLRLHDYSVLPAVAEWLRTQPPSPPSLLMPRDALFEMQFRLGNQIQQISDPSTLPILLTMSQLSDPIVRDDVLYAVKAITSSTN